MSTCRVCDAASKGAFLCRACLAEIERALAEMPSDLADLQAVATRQATGPLGLGDPAREWNEPPADGALGDAPWVFAWGAADQLWAAQNTLSTWVRHLCETRGVRPPTATLGRFVTRLRIDRNRMVRGREFVPFAEQPIADLSRWLLAHLDAIRYDEAAEQIHEELTGLHAENAKWILGKPPADEFFGLCDAPDVRVQLEDGTMTPIAGTCGAQLFGPARAERIDCPACGVNYTRAQRHASMLADMREYLATVRQAASVLTTLGKAVTVKQIDGWIRRSLIVTRGQDANGHRLVLVGDVLDQRKAMLERAATRRRKVAA